MAVRLRLKRMGRKHRPFFSVCSMDARCARDGKVIEELGYYDPMVSEVDARAILKGERIDYWLGVGAQPTPKVKVLIKKYGNKGTHVDQQQTALERLRTHRPTAPPPVAIPRPKPPEPEAAPVADETAAGNEPAAEAAAEGGDAAPAESNE